MRFRNANRIPIATQGNSIVEYTLIGCLVLLLCMGSFWLLSGNLNGKMQGLKQDMSSHSQAALSAKAQVAQQMANAQAQMQASMAGSVSTNSGAVQTVGANGTTAAYAADILSNAKQGLDSGAITQAEYDMVVKLANKGHDIATIQGLLENAFTQSGGDSTAYAASNLTFNGQNYTPTQLNDILASNINDFSTMRQQASVLNGVLYDQALLNSINDAGGNIINSGNATEQQNQTAASFAQYQSSGTGVASTGTNQQSAIICTNGEHLDSGNHCVP
jgi:hypothetical protein